MRHTWRSALVLEAPQAVGLSQNGIELGGEVKAWAALSDVGFVRYKARRGTNEELWLSFGPGDIRRLRWVDHHSRRGDWKAMLVDFAGHAARHRPDLTLRDGPTAAEARGNARIGLGIMAIALFLMCAMLFSEPTFLMGLVAVWIGLCGALVGGLVRRFYMRKGDPPRLDWAGFAAREGRAGELPAN